MKIMNCVHEGIPMLGIPIMPIERYLSAPVCARWLYHLEMAMMFDLFVAFTDCSEAGILSLIGPGGDQ